jgi:hypothetical protein
MFVDLFQRRVFEGLMGPAAVLRFSDGGPVLGDLDANSVSLAFRRSYIAIMRSSFSTPARGSSATVSINPNTAEGVSDGGAPISG